MTTAVLVYAVLCLALSAVLVLIMAVQRLVPLLSRTRSAVEELAAPQVDAPLRTAA